MCEEPIWADEQTLAAAQAAGWQAGEVRWEAMQEAAMRHCARAERQAANRLWQGALALARRCFAEDDPRLGSSLANAGGDEQLAQAKAIWQRSPVWIDRLAPAPAARSSLHHLRLEQKHRRTYQAQARRRLQDAAAEARAILDGQTQKTAAEQLARWQKEKPPVFNDSRRLLAACFLLALRER